LKDVKDSLAQSEEAMKGFQEKTGAIKIDEQTRAVRQSFAKMKAAPASKEVQLKVMRTYATSHNPDAPRLGEEVRGLKEQLSRLEAESGQSTSDPLMPTSRVPHLGATYARKMRELKYNEALYEILMKQFEAAKLDEVRDSAVIQVIEKAEPRNRKQDQNGRRWSSLLSYWAFSFLCSLPSSLSMWRIQSRTLTTQSAFGR
jgi:tyrosine-protein kinase Etk/Wzc